MITLMNTSKLSFIKNTIQGKLGAWKALYKCECGTEVEFPVYKVDHGYYKSCGCLRGFQITHGLNNHPLYKVWDGMKCRCYNENAKCFKRYGGRGIKICDEWVNNAVAFIKWGIDNGYQKGLQIDRIKNDLDYSPDNCRFVTSMVNANNKRNNILITIANETNTLVNWVRHYNSDYSMVLRRLRRGWNELDALTLPSNQHKKYKHGRS